MTKTTRIPLIGSELPIDGALQIGTLPHDRAIDVIIHLRRKPSSPGLSTADELATSPPPKPLTIEELTTLHGADPDDVAKVCSFLNDYGLSVHEVNLTTRLVHACGTIADASRAFGVYLGTYSHIDYDRDFRAYLGAVSLPAKLDGIVLGIHGLDDRPKSRPHVQVSTDVTSLGTSIENRYPGKFLPPEVAALYDFPSGTGQGQSIGIIEIGGPIGSRKGGGFHPQVLQYYFEKITGTPVPKITPIPVMGSHNNPYGRGSVEVYLDIEVVGSIAPGTDIAVYFADHLAIAVKAAITDPCRSLTAITISYGSLEMCQSQNDIDLMEDALQEAANLGIPVFISSGDNGSGALRAQAPYFTQLAAKANASYPSTSPYAIACGGTELVVAQHGGIESETVWNDVQLGPNSYVGEDVPHGASGGGVSVLFPVPAYQSSNSVNPQSINPSGGSGRGVPDVCGNAARSSGYIISSFATIDGHEYIGFQYVGGTSAVAPLWAALAALLGENLGNKGPLKSLTHQFFYTNGSSNLFHSITEGENNTSPPVGGYQAGPGWNACCGWGSPNGKNILAALSNS